MIDLETNIPDGKGKDCKDKSDDLSDYKDWDEWGYDEWAWQYLRRNEVFQENCRALDALADHDPENELLKKKVAAGVFLKEFKDFREPLLYDDEGFFPVTVKHQGTEFTVRENQLAIVIDARVLKYFGGVDALLDVIREPLEKKRDEILDAIDAEASGIFQKIAGELGVSSFKDLPPKMQEVWNAYRCDFHESHEKDIRIERDRHIDILRAFDLDKAGVPQKKIPDYIETLDHDTVRKTLAVARWLINGGYVSVVTAKTSRRNLPKRA